MITLIKYLILMLPKIDEIYINDIIPLFKRIDQYSDTFIFEVLDMYLTVFKSIFSI